MGISVISMFEHQFRRHQAGGQGVADDAIGCRRFSNGMARALRIEENERRGINLMQRIRVQHLE